MRNTCLLLENRRGMPRTLLPGQKAGSAGTPATLLLTPVIVMTDTACLTNHQIRSQQALRQRAGTGRHANMPGIFVRCLLSMLPLQFFPHQILHPM